MSRVDYFFPYKMAVHVNNVVIIALQETSKRSDSKLSSSELLWKEHCNTHRSEWHPLNCTFRRPQGVLDCRREGEITG